MINQSYRRGTKRPLPDEFFHTASIKVSGPEEALAALEQTSLCEQLSEIQPIPLRLAMRNAKFAWKKHATTLELPDRTLLALFYELSQRHPEVLFRVQVSPTTRRATGETLSHISDVTILESGQGLRRFESQDPEDPAWSWILNPAYDLWSERQHFQEGAMTHAPSSSSPALPDAE